MFIGLDYGNSLNSKLAHAQCRELLIYSSKFQADAKFLELTVGSNIITPTPHAWSIGVTFDKFLTMSARVRRYLLP
jgi:hypothetical protein